MVIKNNMIIHRVVFILLLLILQFKRLHLTSQINLTAAAAEIPILTNSYPISSKVNLLATTASPTLKPTISPTSPTLKPQARIMLTMQHISQH